MPRSGEPLCLSSSVRAADGVTCWTDCGMSSGATAGACAEVAGKAVDAGSAKSPAIGAGALIVYVVAVAAVVELAGFVAGVRRVVVRVTVPAAGFFAVVLGVEVDVVVVLGVDVVVVVVVGVVEPGVVEPGWVDVTCVIVWSSVVMTLSGDGSGGSGSGSALATPLESRHKASAPVDTPTARRVKRAEVMRPSLSDRPPYTNNDEIQQW